MSGIVSEHTYIAVGKMILRSAATIEVVWIDRDNWGQAEEGTNPFHIGTTASWTQCTRLKELGISLKGGSLMTDYRWEVPLAFSVFEPIKDYSTVFGQLEKLRLAVKESLWEVCTDGNFNGGGGYWDGYNYYSNYNEFYGIDFDEKDDKDWKPLTAVTPTEEEKTREHTERNHQRAFILQVRELFGRLKDLKQLRDLEIEWYMCLSISEVTLENALELFCETEVTDNNNNTGGYERTSKGWWGEVNQEDLVWLCLPWLPQPHIQSSIVPSHLIKAAARQYENKTQLPAGSHDIPDCSNERPPWSTGDVYNARVGRQWKDWDDINQGCHPYTEAGTRCSGSCYRGGYCNSYTSARVSHVVHSRDFEIFVVGVAESEEFGWGRKMRTRGDRGRYRQKAVGKMNQRK
ncbi:hypothetical protein BKA57DRAFT_456607 [Linnemannia elongata]|nr:hypothetical protein BKA57DRAFT_456607 [Linnemannia elongata]